MKKALLTILLSLSILVPLQASPLSEMLHRVMRSVAYLDIKGKDESGHCTAWMVSLPNKWATAQHCFDILPNATYTINGEEVLVTKIDKGKDLILLQGPAGTPLSIAKHNPELGDKIYLLGWPAGWASERPKVSFGFVAADPEMDEDFHHEMYPIQSGGGRGMSGGPVVNDKGEVVGMFEAIDGGFPQVVSMTMWSQTLHDIQRFYR